MEVVQRTCYENSNPELNPAAEEASVHDDMTASNLEAYEAGLPHRADDSVSNNGGVRRTATNAIGNCCTQGTTGKIL